MSVRIYKTLTVFNSSRKRLRLNSGWNADAQARLRLNSCRKTQLRLSCDAQLGCVKLSDCVPKRLRRKAASGAIAFEPRLERNRPFAKCAPLPASQPRLSRCTKLIFSYNLYMACRDGRNR